MSDQNRSTQSNGCLLPVMFTVAVLLALALGGVGGAMLDVDTNRQTTIYPDIPAPSAVELHVVPSVQTFADQPVDPCASAESLADYAGWENGVGGQYPPCWASWTLQQQNAFLRSH